MIRHIQSDVLKEENSPAARLGSRIAARFAKIGLQKPLPELRGTSQRCATSASQDARGRSVAGTRVKARGRRRITDRNGRDSDS
jgi:hypothetical protein